MLSISKIVAQIDAFVWGPVMLVLLVGTGVLLTVRCNFLTWRNLPWALKKTLSKEARTKSRGNEMFPRFRHLQPPLPQQSEPAIS